MQRTLSQIRLRPLQPTDKQDYLRWRLDPLIGGVMRGGIPQEAEIQAELQMRFEQPRADEIYLCFEAIQPSTTVPQELIHAGDIRIRKTKDRKSYAFNESHGVWEFGLQCDQHFWGDTELSAIVAMLDVAFMLKGAVRVEDTLWSGNHRSIDVLEKAGFTREGLLRKRLWRNDEWIDEVFLGITEDDYQKLWGHSLPHWNYDEIKRIL